LFLILYNFVLFVPSVRYFKLEQTPDTSLPRGVQYFKLTITDQLSLSPHTLPLSHSNQS